MIVRIVKMTFDEEGVKPFLENFSEVKNNIRSSNGCLHLELLRDKGSPNVFFTYSHWKAESFS